MLDAGTGSLGGARPKASVKTENSLFIAKFPHPADTWDTTAWEKIALDIAAAAGIRVPATELISVGNKNVLLVERFDRLGAVRIGYISAMTLLEANDGDAHDYLEITQAIPEFSATATHDLRELWRRMVFSIAINNTDDHLRNHGFLRKGGGWELAPAFDINPNPELSARRVTSIAGSPNPLAEINAAMKNASLFDLNRMQAQQIVEEIVGQLNSWKKIAENNQITRKETERFAPIFERGISTLRSLK